LTAPSTTVYDPRTPTAKDLKVNRLISIMALSALAACGGGGGGGGGGFVPAAPVESAPAAHEPARAAPEAPLIPPDMVTATCETHSIIFCEMVASDRAIGIGVPAGTYVAFTNNTGAPLQVVETGAFTAERRFWSEYCAYLGTLNDSVTWQRVAGKGEVGCAAKNIGEDYAPIRFGTGLVVAPGEVVVLNSHTEPTSTNHTYTLKVRALTDAGQSWRQPQRDQVIPCDGQTQYTVAAPWRNDADRNVQITGASIYAEVPQSKAPNTVSNACISVLLEGGATKYSNCDTALRSKGEVHFPPVTVAPGEYVAAQAANACAVGGHWNWAAFLNVK